MQFLDDFLRTQIFTYTGLRLDLLNPQPEMICIEDIAIGLKNQARFGGQTWWPITVAEHSVRACELASFPNKLEALLHDASEAYLGDMPTPAKQLMPDYQAIEDALMKAIYKRFGLQYPFSEEVKLIDKVLLEKEITDYVRNKLQPVTPDHAYTLFMSHFNSLIKFRE